MKQKLLISVGLIVCLLMAFALPMCAPAPAPPVEEEEEEVEELAKYIKAYMCMSPDPNLIVANFIEEELGVAVRQTYTACGELHSKLIAEAPNFAADMVIRSCGPQGFLAAKEGWTIPYDSPTWREDIEWKDPDNNWFNLGKNAFFLCWNKDLLAEAGYEPPESYDDFLDPKWKGQIVMPSPLTSGTSFRMLVSFLYNYGINAGKGEEGGWEYMKALDKNVHHYTKSGNAPTDLVGRGEFMLSITGTENILSRVGMGYPIGWAVAKEGVASGVSPAFILKGCTELYTCQKIIDLLGTEKSSQVFADNAGIIPKHPVPNPLWDPFGGAPKYMPNVDIPWAYDNKARLCDEWKDRIGRVAR